MGCRISLLPLHDTIQKLATTTGPQLQFPARVLLSGILQCNRHCICTSRYCKAIKAFALGFHGQHYRGYGPEEEPALPQRDLKVARSTEEDAQLYNWMKANRHSYPSSSVIATYCNRDTQHSSGQGNPFWQHWEKDRLARPQGRGEKKELMLVTCPLLFPKTHKGFQVLANQYLLSTSET